MTDFLPMIMMGYAPGFHGRKPGAKIKMQKISIAETINDEKLGNRVREMRKWLRLSQEGVANFIEVPRTAISNIESGEREMSVMELVRLCQLFHCKPHSLLGISALPIVPDEPAVTGHKINTRGKHDDENLDARDDAEIRNFKHFLGKMPAPNSGPLEDARKQTFKSPKQAADWLADRFSMTKPPVDIYEIIFKLGIYPRFSSLGTLSGALLRDHEERGVFGIIVNSDQPDDRIRFSAAHEVAHLLLAHKPNESEVRSPRGRKYDVDERDADVFAAELLMPAKAIEREAKEHKEISAEVIYRLSDQYAVSYAAMLRRVFDLSLISNGSYSSFQEKKVSELEAKTSTKKKVKAKKFEPKQTLDVVEELEAGLKKSGTAPDFFDSPDWVRLLQEKTYYKYLTETPVDQRDSEVREVYEEVALWVAKNRPMKISLEF